MLARQKTRQFRFQACTRCHGDAYLDRSEYEPEWRCLQCGRPVPLTVKEAFALINDEQEPIAA